MSDINLDVYLYFKGQCREAMEFYKSIFGGEINAMPYSQVPDQVPGGEGISEDWLMHALLSGGDIRLMASDTLKASPTSAKVDLSLGGQDEARLREIFEKLSEGGEVHTPLKKEFWGDIFGNLTDKFGVTWMVNISSGENS
ncbi:MAG TPA: VOC family protein [Candidatus Saccharimonadales bacterium]|nr:VOC family protein [Candidatus Saccharimonadales bacterium]